MTPPLSYKLALFVNSIIARLGGFCHLNVVSMLDERYLNVNSPEC